jgi:hypothetical protein
MELDPIISLLQSENPHVDSDDLAGGLPGTLSEWRGISFRVGWAIAALITTGGWLYFITRAVYLILNWLLG